VLTDTRGNQATTVVYNDPMITDTFDVSFEVKITPNAQRGDGMGFMIEKAGKAVVGAKGGGLGMAGLNGYGVELDLFDNTRPATGMGGCGDSDNNHISVDSLDVCLDWNGNAVPTMLAKSPNLQTFSIDLADGVFHACAIHVVNGVVTVSLDGHTAVAGATLPAFQPGDMYYFGFSGGTGDFANRQEIKNVSIHFPTARCL
jgi:hypothetical protein